jgi:hypothetical protein
VGLKSFQALLRDASEGKEQNMNPSSIGRAIVWGAIGFTILWVNADNGQHPPNTQTQKISYQLHPQTGAISLLAIENDARKMNWMLETDGSQYAWVKKNYGWGLGFFHLVSGGNTLLQEWTSPVEVQTSNAGTKSVYAVGDIRITVERTHDKNDLIETYVFTNTGKSSLQLVDIGINTPFNDNYPSATVCMQARANAHIWDGENAAYVNALHMSGKAPHLGLVVTDGSVKSYEIKERGNDRGSSNFRGVIILNPENMQLNAGENKTLAWRIFSHTGQADFRAKTLNAGSIVARSDKYVLGLGETANLTFETQSDLKDPQLYQNGEKIALTKKDGGYTAAAKINKTGDIRFELVYDGGKKTHISCLGISGEDELIRKRVDFILAHQQLNDPQDRRYGAFMVYDNEENKIFLNDKPSVSPADRDEGAERIGMGIFLTQYYLKTKDPRVKEALIKYASFVRNKLQNKDYRTWSDAAHKSRNRVYNYSWVSWFYFNMFQVTGDRQFLLDGFATSESMYKQFGHDLYFSTPIASATKLLRENQMNDLADRLLDHVKKSGDLCLKNGEKFLPFEVAYDRGQVQSAIVLYMDLYFAIGEKKYFDGVAVQLPLLESFLGAQPSYHLNDITLSHWDGYWFGKRATWGDVLPHHWCAGAGLSYALYAKATGNVSYQKKAENIVRNVLCTFFEDGRASCAYIYPYKVNGVKAQFYDPFANDQDWALAYYLMVNEK